MHYTCREESTDLDIYPQRYRAMSVPSLCQRCRSNIKIFRPERCIVLDGQPRAACTEDIELETDMNELKIGEDTHQAPYSSYGYERRS